MDLSTDDKDLVERLNEETMRVPLVIGGPGITEGLVSTLDLVPTLVTRCTLGIDQPVHGYNLGDLLEGRTTSVRDGFMAQHNDLHVHLPQRAYYNYDMTLWLPPSAGSQDQCKRTSPGFETDSY